MGASALVLQRPNNKRVNMNKVPLLLLSFFFSPFFFSIFVCVFGMRSRCSLLLLFFLSQHRQPERNRKEGKGKERGAGGEEGTEEEEEEPKTTATKRNQKGRGAQGRQAQQAASLTIPNTQKHRHRHTRRQRVRVVRRSCGLPWRAQWSQGRRAPLPAHTRRRRRRRRRRKDMSNEQQKAGSTKGVFTSPPHPLSPSLSVSLPLYLSLSLSISLSICLCLSPSSLVWNSHACATSRGCLSMHGAPRPQPWLSPSLCWAWQGTPSRGKGTSSGNQSPPKCIHSCVCVCVYACGGCASTTGMVRHWQSTRANRIKTYLRQGFDSCLHLR